MRKATEMSDYVRGVHVERLPNVWPMASAEAYEYQVELERGELPGEFVIAPSEDIQASIGSDLTGSMDIRGLGDNTDTPDLSDMAG